MSKKAKPTASERVHACLQRSGNLTVRGLSNATGFGTATVHSALRSLEKQGFAGVAGTWAGAPYAPKGREVSLWVAVGELPAKEPKVPVVEREPYTLSQMLTQIKSYGSSPLAVVAQQLEVSTQ